MRTPCSILVFSVLLSLGACLAVPAEDVPETAYDESEALRYVNTSVFSMTAPIAPAPVLRAVAPLRLGSLKRPGTQRSEKGTGKAYPIGDSLAILEHSFRC